MDSFIKGMDISSLAEVERCGWANEAALAFTGEKGPGGNEWANQALFDYDGNALPALKTIRDFR